MTAENDQAIAVDGRVPPLAEFTRTLEYLCDLAQWCGNRSAWVAELADRPDYAGRLRLVLHITVESLRALDDELTEAEAEERATRR